MSYSEFSLQTTDGLNLFACRWAPDEAPAVGLVCLVHGYGEHVGRYEHVARTLNRAGYAVVGIDHRGHGRSPGKRGHTPSYEQSFDDVGVLIRSAQERFPHRPTFLYGHSMGGGLVLGYTLHRRPDLQGVVCTSPWLRLAEPPPGIVEGVAAFAAKLMPSFSIDQGGDDDRPLLSRDPQIQADFDADPLTHGRISVSLFSNATANGRWVLSNAPNFPLPLYLTHGTGDLMTDYTASKRFAAKAPPHVTFKSWPDGAHELHNDFDKADVLADIIAWLKEHTPPPQNE